MLNPGGIIAWVVVGIIAGWATGKIMRGSGYGVVGDLILGLLGALVGGFIANLFVPVSLGIVGTTIVAIIGAVILVAIARAISGNKNTL